MPGKLIPTAPSSDLNEPDVDADTEGSSTTKALPKAKSRNQLRRQKNKAKKQTAGANDLSASDVEPEGLADGVVEPKVGRHLLQRSAPYLELRPPCVIVPGGE